MKASNSYLGNVSHRTWLYLALILAAGWDVAPAGWRGLRSFQGQSVGTERCAELDSFSEPAVATTVLKEEAERLSLAFRDCADREFEAADTDAKPVSAQGRPSVERAATIKAMEDLRLRAQDFKTDLLRKLLDAYAESRLWPEFLDRYLDLVHEAPENPFVVVWADCALTHAQDCHRTDEVVRALEQVTWRNPNSNVARGVRSVLEEREGEGSLHLAVWSP